ncbi:hypothetical protein C8N24_2057 [Solirubrobacter pauli]|uniref:Ig-like domain-containing protein n=1 Tax=Solirubrobacter pauli TaxID=166793 RepID=A0A660LGX8_9ACTN|nr:hypothetical protein [Solirubrobacter pauli]RKQ92214.1 hypothetical protein C8N24_2057 [Solirubrobacter pauli]
MTSMFLRTTATATALFALLAGSASAATLTRPLDPCYVVATEAQRQSVLVEAEGFTPFSKVDIFVDEVLQDQPPTLWDGKISGRVLAPWSEVGQRAFTLRVSEPAKPENTIEATSLVTRLSVQQSPSRARTADRVRFRGSGFLQAGLPVYAHYVFAGKARKTVKLNVPQGPCGTFSVKRRQFPFKNSPRVGVWTIWFDQNPRYDPKAAGTRVPMTIKVRRTTKQGSASSLPR